MSDAGDVVELSEEERRTIDAIYERRMTATHYEILGVARDAERKTIRDAYFALSKRFHPDVFFNRSLGDYRVRIDELFRVFTRAYDVLGNARQRAGYDLHIGSLERPSRPPPASVPEVTGIVSAARDAARQTTPEPTRPGASTPGVPAVSSAPPRSSSPTNPAAQLPPPARTAPRPMMPPIGTAVVPPAHTHAAPAAPVSKATPAPMQPLDPETLRRARESMARRLSSVVPQRPSSAPVRGPTAPPVGMPPSSPSHQQIPRMAERAVSAAQLVANAEEAQRKGDFSAATEALKQALALNKDDEALRLRYEATRKLLVAQQVDGHISAAREAMRDGQPLVAAKHWEQAAEGRPTDALLWLNAAEVLAKYTKEYKRATDLAQRVTMADPSNVKAHALLAGIFIKAGLKASAYASIQTIARLSPDFPALKDLREKLGPYTLAEKVGLRSR
ncbi:MAG: DnaJ domain-containing protein [Deltaproteobacteria bacterium]|nr:DnaJ domain-containing protein [Myxococcales bacterium]MDP3218034.1 DnaJ domain-containing protein [Deltaproteobacteria bacterium]